MNTLSLGTGFGVYVSFHAIQRINMSDRNVGNEE